MKPEYRKWTTPELKAALLDIDIEITKREPFSRSVPSESTESMERAFQMLEANGVPRERAKTVANGIDVLATRIHRDEGFQQMMAKDAARYRWLRTHGVFFDSDVQDNERTAEILDGALDNAMRRAHEQQR